MFDARTCAAKAGRTLSPLYSSVFEVMPAGAHRVAIAAFARDRTDVTIRDLGAFMADLGEIKQAKAEGNGLAEGAGYQRRPGWAYCAPRGLESKNR